MKVTVMMCFNQFILQLSQTYKNLQENVHSGLLIRSLIILKIIISITKYNPLAGSSYIKLSKELDHPRKRLIDIQSIDDNEYVKCCLVRYLNPADHHPARITKLTKILPKSFI